MAINAIVVFVYLLAMVALGVYLSRYVKSEEDYFLAGRSLNKWIIAGSIMSTNVAAIYLVGPAGAAYGGGGVSTLLIAWTGNMIAAMSALFFVPHLRSMRITTVSEYLEDRYGVALRLLPAGLWMLYYALFAGVGMCTLSTVLSPILGVPVESLIIFVGGGVLLYCCCSGLIGAAYSSVIQAFIMILGGLILLPLALKQVGGLQCLYETLSAQGGESFFVFWKGGDAGVWPTWKDVFMFVMLGLPYWCTSQYMVQRSFAGKSVRESSRGVILAALMTGPLTLSFIIPGICGVVLYGGVVAGDDALPSLLNDFLPLGLGGLILAALVAASNSTASALLSSLSTLAQHDYYRRFIPGKNAKHYMWVARVATLIGGVIGIAFAFVAREYGIIQTAYNLMGFFEPPIFVIVAGALFWKRANSWGAISAAVVGIAFNFLSRFVFGMDAATQTILCFPVSTAALMVGTYVSRAAGAKSAAEEGQTMFSGMSMSNLKFSVSGWFGVIWAVGSLWAFIICSFCESALPKPANMFIYLFLMMSFVLGCYFAVPAFVPETDEDKAEDKEGIATSLTHRIIGSGWTWFAVYLISFALMFGLYGAVKPDPTRAYKSMDRAEVAGIAKALDGYRKINAAFPTANVIAELQRKQPSGFGKGKPYLRAPLDGIDARGNAINVQVSSDGQAYSVSARGADGKAGTDDDITSP
ncbi:MAG: sodium/solute symporter [Lentisphaeria bacterium]|nr:sodium/solute symporter [Lentisphaeria bacterium]